MPAPQPSRVLARCRSGRGVATLVSSVARAGQQQRKRQKLVLERPPGHSSPPQVRSGLGAVCERSAMTASRDVAICIGTTSPERRRTFERTSLLSGVAVAVSSIEPDPRSQLAVPPTTEPETGAVLDQIAVAPTWSA